MGNHAVGSAYLGVPHMKTSQPPKLLPGNTCKCNEGFTGDDCSGNLFTMLLKPKMVISRDKIWDHL